MTYKVVHIKWIDSETSHGWEAPEDAMEEMSLAESVGYLIGETKDAVVLAHSICPSTGHINGRIHIPHVAVSSMRTLCRIKMKMK